MKQYLYPILALLSLAILTRLPHPARDISKLDPVQSVYIYMEGKELHMVTDTQDHGRGPDLSAAAAQMKASADREIYLETAEYLVLDPNLAITPDFYTLLRPSARVAYAGEVPDLAALTAYLSAHPPERTLNDIRAGQYP